MSDFAETWNGLGRRWKQFFGAWLGGFVVVAAIIYLSSLIGTLVFAWVAAIAWMILFLVTGFRVQSFPCPRCGRPFFGRERALLGIPLYSNNVFRKTCGFCGLAKGAAA